MTLISWAAASTHNTWQGVEDAHEHLKGGLVPGSTSALLQGLCDN